MSVESGFNPENDPMLQKAHQQVVDSQKWREEGPISSGMSEVDPDVRNQEARERASSSYHQGVQSEALKQFQQTLGSRTQNGEQAPSDPESEENRHAA